MSDKKIRERLRAREKRQAERDLDLYFREEYSGEVAEASHECMPHKESVEDVLSDLSEPEWSLSTSSLSPTENPEQHVVGDEPFEDITSGCNKNEPSALHEKSVAETDTSDCNGNEDETSSHSDDSHEEPVQGDYEVRTPSDPIFSEAVSVSHTGSEIISEDEESCDDGHSKLKDELATWSVDFHIAGTAVTALLNILRHNGHPNLPKSSKTLNKTPRTTRNLIKSLGGGTFWYRGVLKGMESQLSAEYLKTLSDGSLVTDIFIDGLSPYKSVQTHLWPIAGCLRDQKTPFVIALWCGDTKEPGDLDAFFKDFIEEVENLSREGLVLHGRHFTFTIRNYIADAPARAWMKRVNQHNSKICCKRCTVKCHWVDHRMIFDPEEVGTPRTDETFSRQDQKEYHKGESPLLKIGAKMISQFPLDPMHMLYSGATKRILGRLLEKKKSKYKLPNEVLSQISNLCGVLAKHTPSEFMRKPRELKYWKIFKATEFRRILLYDGFVMFKRLPYPEIYTNFLLLSCAIRLLTDPILVSEYADDADTLLKTFVEHSCKIFGQNFVVFNIHHLIHLADDCKRHGSLENFSCFKFENYLGPLKSLLRAPGRSLPQLVCRLMEKVRTLPGRSSTEKISFSQPHESGPTLDCRGQGFKKMQTPEFMLRLTENDAYCLTKGGDVVWVHNIVQCDDKARIVGRKFTTKTNYVDYPFPSGKINVWEVRFLGPLEKWDVDDIRTKIGLFPLEWHEINVEFNWERNPGLCIPLLYGDEAGCSDQSSSRNVPSTEG